jgi:four helix bundle protein
MRDHHKLTAFKLADQLALSVYALTAEFPQSEIYGLTSQMRRAAVSVPSNIVEGCARETKTEYLRFLDIAFASLRELHYQYTLAERLGYLNSKSSLQSDFVECEKVLGGLIRSLRRS